MDREEAAAQLAQRYRVRVILEVRHGDRAVTINGSTMDESPSELIAGAPTFFTLILTRALQQLEQS